MSSVLSVVVPIYNVAPYLDECLSSIAAQYHESLDVVERAAATGALRPGTEPVTVSFALWASVHGLVSLQLRGLHPADAPAPDEVFDGALRAAVTGWLPAVAAV